MSRVKTSPSRGFSLRDLIITLVLLVGVLVLLMPKLRDIQQTKNGTACLVNLRENGLATLAYSLDHDGTFPRFGFDCSSTEQGLLRVDMVLRTAQESGIDQYTRENLACPSDQKLTKLCVGKDSASAERVTVGYGYNVNLIRNSQTLSGLSSPATTTVLYDGSMAGACVSKRDVSVGGLYQDGLAFAQHASDARHAEKINLVYADWHTVTVDRLSRPSVEIGDSETDRPD